MSVSYAGSQQKAINLFNVSALKSTSDEQLNSILESAGYTPSHHLVDVRLAIGYSSILVAAVTAYIDYTKGFFQGKTFISIGVAFYVILNLAYTYWIWAIEKGVEFYGTKSNGSTIAISTKKGTEESKYDPIYNISIKFSTKGQDEKSATVVTKKIGFNEFFATNGFIVYDKLESWVKDAVKETEEKAHATVSKKIN